MGAIFTRVAEYNNLANTINRMNFLLQYIFENVGNSKDYSQFNEEILVLSYMLRKGVYDRIDQYQWNMNTKIIIPTIKNSPIRLRNALTIIVDNFNKAIEESGLRTETDDIQKKGELYYKVESRLPIEIKNKI